MSKVKFEGLIEVPSQGNLSYKQSLLIPMDCSMGSQISTASSIADLYSKVTPRDLDLCKSLEKYINLGYELVIYRTNYMNAHSSIRLNETGYSYFDSNKTYSKSNGSITSVSELTSTLTCNLNLDSIIESLFRNTDVEYNVVFYVNNFSYCIHISESPISYSQYDAVREVKFLTDGLPDVYKVKNSIIKSITEFIGLKIDGDIIKSEYEFSYSSEIPELLTQSNINDTYDIIHSNSLSLSGLSLVSRVPVSDGKIKLIISLIGNSINFRVSTELEGKLLYEESILGDRDPESSDYIINKLSESKLIKYVDGEWNDSFVGEYELGYLTESESDLNSVRFDTDKLSRYDIMFVVEPRNFYTKSELWEVLDMDPEWDRPYDPTNEDLLNDEFIGDQYEQLIAEFEPIYTQYVKDVTSYLRRLSKLATKIDSVALVGDVPLDDSQLSTFNNLIVVNPRIVDLEYNYTYELLLANLSNNRLSGDVEFEGRLSNIKPTNVGTAELIYTQYKYLLTEVKFKFMSSRATRSSEITLSNYMVWYAVLKYMDKVIKSEFLGKMNEVDIERLTSLTLTEFSGFLRSLSVTNSKSGRTLTLQVSMELETQTRESLVLTGYLIGE